MYRQPNDGVKEFEKQLNKILLTNDILKKMIIMGADFNINLNDFEQNQKVQNFLNIMFGHSMMPVLKAVNNTHTKETKERFIFKRKLSDNSVENFKYKLCTISWGSITNSSDTNKAYDNFIEIFS